MDLLLISLMQQPCLSITSQKWAVVTKQFYIYKSPLYLLPIDILKCTSRFSLTLFIMLVICLLYLDTYFHWICIACNKVILVQNRYPIMILAQKVIMNNRYKYHCMERVSCYICSSVATHLFYLTLTV